MLRNNLAEENYYPQQNSMQKNYIAKDVLNIMEKLASFKKSFPEEIWYCVGMFLNGETVLFLQQSNILNFTRINHSTLMISQKFNFHFFKEFSLEKN